MIGQLAHLLFLMAAGHALGDRPLQEGAIRADKYAPRDGTSCRWLYGLLCHALIHGGIVAIVTGLWWLGLAETALHAVIDDAKLRGKFGLVVDQILHGVCKVVWAVLAVTVAGPY